MVVNGTLSISGAFSKPLSIFRAILGSIRMRIGSLTADQPVKGQIGMAYVNSTDPELGEYANRVVTADVEIDVS
jgi:hypothetical protein